MQRWSEAQQSFYEDVREKKKAASGVHHKTGKNGYVGTMRFPSDIMSRKEKYNHRKASKVMTSNLYDTIVALDEFNELEKEEQRVRMLYWRNKYSNKEIQKAMGIGNSPYYKIVDELELPKARRINGTTKPKRQAIATTAKKNLLAFAEKPAPIEPASIEPAPPAPIPEAPPVQELIVDGLHIVFNGTYSAEHIIKQLSKFELILDGEPDDFYIEIKLTQKASKKEEAL